jgi:thymidylate synthase (FAD)
MLTAGVAKESARKILPMNSPTRLYMAGTIRSWIHYLPVRKGPETQLEHRVIAEEINRILNVEMPNLWEVVG